MTNTSPATACIACALLSESAVPLIAGMDESDMPGEREKAILSAIKELAKAGTCVDLTTVDAKTGGLYTNYLIDSMTGTATTTNAQNYITLAKEEAARTRLRSMATNLYNRAGDISLTVDEIAAEFQSMASGFDAVSSGTTMTATEALRELADSLDKANRPRAMTGIPLLDRTIGGMSGGRLYVLGARPATGKSALAIASAVVTAQANGTVLICSYEMAASEIMGRIMSNMSGVSSQNIAYRTLTVEEHQQLMEHYGKAASLPLRFMKGAPTPESLRATALKMAKDGLRLIVVDYLQLMSSGKRAENRRIEVGQISRALKQLSIELDVPVLALSQLNRLSEMSESKVPSMAEMRESGDIEQDADVIVLMYRPPEDDSVAKECEMRGYSCIRLLVDKNRHGKAGVKIDTAFDGEGMRFLPISVVMRERNGNGR